MDPIPSMRHEPSTRDGAGGEPGEPNGRRDDASGARGCNALVERRAHGASADDPTPADRTGGWAGDQKPPDRAAPPSGTNDVS